jgi:hypothetical protein
MNSVYETDVPARWKMSMLHMIYKGKGDRGNSAKYRGHLLSSSSKIYTGVLMRRLDDWVERRGAVSKFQMEFRKGRRSTDNIFILITVIDKHLARKRGKYTGYL